MPDPVDRPVAPSEALAEVDAVVTRALQLGDELCLVQGRLWRPFLHAAGLTPYAVGSDQEVEFRGVRLRESIVY